MERTLTRLVGLRFGGGFEFMKAGRDMDGLWTDLEFGIGYVPNSSAASVPCNFSIESLASSHMYHTSFLFSPQSREIEARLYVLGYFAEHGFSSGYGWVRTGRIYSTTW